jgi:hypothetical protein
MTQRTLARNVALTTGLGALIVLTVGTLYWQELLIRYHLFRLARDDGYLRGVLDEPTGTIIGHAVERFIQNPSRIEPLVKAYVLEIAHRDENARRYLNSGRYDEVLMGLGGRNQLEYFAVWDEPGWATKGSGSGTSFSGTETTFLRLAAIQRILASKKVENTAMDEYADAEISFLCANDIPANSLIHDTGSVRSSTVCWIRWPKRTAEKEAKYRAEEERRMMQFEASLNASLNALPTKWEDSGASYY